MGVVKGVQLDNAKGTWENYETPQTFVLPKNSEENSVTGAGDFKKVFGCDTV